jgi:hypothetical protein
MPEGADSTGGPESADGDGAGWAAPDHTAPNAASGPASGPAASAPRGPSPTAPIDPPGSPPPGSPPPGMAPPPGVPAAPGVGPLPAPTTPARRRGRGWVVVLVVALTVIAVALIAGTVLFIDRTVPPYDAARDFLHDVIRGRPVSGQLCADDRKNAEGAVARVDDTFNSSSSFGGAKISVNSLGVDRSDDTATVKYAVDPSVGSTHTFKLPMREEGGDWKACPSDGIEEVDG